MCNNVLRNSTAHLTVKEKTEFNIRLTQVRAKKRQRLWVEQDGLCHYCSMPTILPRQGQAMGGKVATLDHIITQTEGGTDSLANMVVACQTCNGNRGDMPYKEFYALMTTPGAWEEHCKAVANAKRLRDEARRAISQARHEETTRIAMDAAQARKLERYRKHAHLMINQAIKKGIKLPKDPEERIQWAINRHLEIAANQRLEAFQLSQYGIDGQKLLSDWLEASKIKPSTEGHGWVGIQPFASMEALPWMDLTGDTERYMMA